MSESELSTPADAPAPTDADIEAALRRVVRAALKDGKDITVNTARTQAEEELDLDTGFFKDDATWKQRSRDIINAAVEQPSSPANSKKSAPKPSSANRSKSTAEAGNKRKSDEPQPSKKRRKPAVAADSEAEDSLDEDADEEDAPKPKSVRSAARSKKFVSHDDEDPEEPGERAVSKPKDEDESALSEPPEAEFGVDAPRPNGKHAADDDESDLSSVIDDPPPRKKKRQTKSTSPSTVSKTKPKKATAPKAAKAAGKQLSPDEEEIKRLQSWLLKCGVRKLWHRELAKCDGSKEKIRHLKKMLEDVGMTGRFSAEKAGQIKEARELAAEIEAAKEFNQKWGQKGSGEEEDDDDEEEDEDGQGLSLIHISEPTRPY